MAFSRFQEKPKLRSYLNSPNSSEIWRSSFSEFQAFVQTDAQGTMTTRRGP